MRARGAASAGNHADFLLRRSGKFIDGVVYASEYNPETKLLAIGGNFAIVDGSGRRPDAINFALINTKDLSILSNYDISPDNTVFASTSIGDNIYVGGRFESLNTPVHKSTVLFAQNTSPSMGFHPVGYSSGEVNSVVPDGSGGYYLGGSFTQVNGVTRNRLAQINSSGGLTSWNPSVNGNVLALALIGSNVYIGGEFTSVSAITRNRLAAVNTNGNLLTWNPNANNSVLALGTLGNNVYFGGNFTTVGGTTRNRVAAVNTNGNLLTWNPNANNSVRALATLGEDVYIGGEFTSILATTRNRLAAVKANDSLLPWDPNASSGVFALATLGSNVYIGGLFLSVSATTRNRLAAVNTNGNLLTWNPSASSTVRALWAVGSNVYIGGQFTSINATNRNYIAAVSTNGGLLAWAPNANSSVLSISTAGSNVYIGGSFISVGERTSRSKLFAVERTGNLLQDWNPGVFSSIDFEVLALTNIGVNVYIGGFFSSFTGAIDRYSLAAVNTNGSLLSWNPSARASGSLATIRTLTAIGDNIYIGGNFTDVSGTNRYSLAAVNTNGSLLSWNPNTNGEVWALTSIGSNIYIGGQFGLSSGTSRSNLSAVNTAGNLLTWNPSAGNHVSSLATIGDNVYIGGQFTSINSVSQNLLAAVNTNGSLLSWNPGIFNEGSQSINSIAKNDMSITVFYVELNPSPLGAVYRVSDAKRIA